MEILERFAVKPSVREAVISNVTHMNYKVLHGELRRGLGQVPMKSPKSVLVRESNLVEALTLDNALYQNMVAIFNIIDKDRSVRTLTDLKTAITSGNSMQRKGILARCRVEDGLELKWLDVLVKFGTYDIPNWNLALVKGHVVNGILDTKIQQYKTAIDNQRRDQERREQEQRDAEARTRQHTAPVESRPSTPSTPSAQGETEVSKKVRFMSRTNSLEGMTNVKNKLGELGVNAKRLKLTGSSFRPNQEHVIINWGNVDDVPSWYRDDMTGVTVLNKQSAIKVAKNKKKTFDKLKTVVGLADMIPEYTTDKVRAQNWTNDGHTVFCRTLLESSSGNGIIVATHQNDVVNAPLYVKGVDIKHEYRVHVVNGETLIQRKAKLNSDAPHQAIRNYENGYHFINEFSVSDSLKEFLQLVAKRAVQGVGLNFGSVDIVTTEDNVVKILEVNSASGITAPIVIDFYAQNFKALARG